MKEHELFIKAITSHGGDKGQDYSNFFTAVNAGEFESWLEKQPKVSGVTLYRGYKLEKGFFLSCRQAASIWWIFQVFQFTQRKKSIIVV